MTETKRKTLNFEVPVDTYVDVSLDIADMVEILEENGYSVIDTVGASPDDIPTGIPNAIETEMYAAKDPKVKLAYQWVLDLIR
ncbi:hypothetical protein PQI66_10010 [Corynebacterium sp. USCH3]|uniref:hypothetical protein n=1 Tax=Corynebacterium sp. USCH3 TaxID=3024840 RepID=UPI0030AFA6C2